MDSSPAHSESFIQWLWQTLRFDTRSLETTSGEPILIMHPGQQNFSDGPDFKQAHLAIGDLEWRGDIEMHIRESDWYHHGHHRDPNYDNVILHVYLEPGNPAKRFDGSSPPRLNLRPALPDQFQQLVATFAQPERLNCHHVITHISESAIEAQFDKAHREYFEQKTDDLLAFYPSGTPLDEAWREMVLNGLFDGLGIAHNRDSMRRLLADMDLDYTGHASYDPEKLRKGLIHQSGLRSSDRPYIWKTKGCRPANQPLQRIQQGAWHIPYFLDTQLDHFLHAEPKQYWEQWLTHSPPSLRIGQQRKQILFGTVFLPSLYLLGALGASTFLKQRSFSSWQHLQAPIPASLLKPLQNSEIPSSIYRRRLGAVYQLRHYCRAQRCHDCKILKNSLRA
jgi:hypothetical protein